MQHETFNDWRVAHYGISGAHVVPPRSGVYAILRLSRVLGVPHSVAPLYVGRARNLRRRLC